MAFYGRCSTEDNQDPETSRGWQVGNARKLVEPMGDQVVAEFFDVGQSRSVVGAENPVISCDLHVLVNEAAEPVSP